MSAYVKEITEDVHLISSLAHDNTVSCVCMFSLLTYNHHTGKLAVFSFPGEENLLITHWLEMKDLLDVHAGKLRILSEWRSLFLSEKPSQLTLYT